jgi:Holliday junction resolvasome RuvABC ATP-dependent DNA helicase subunit
MTKEQPFENLFGQVNVKKRLKFYLEAFEATSLCPFLAFIGAKGLGKTEFARQFAQQLKNTDGSKRPFLELNCSTIKNVEQFFEQIFIPIIMDNELTVLFDEAHELPKDLTNAFLTVFNTEKVTSKELHWRDAVYPFDFKKQTFMFATTESDKIFPPLKDRLTTIDFEDYSHEDLGNIFKAQCEEIDFSEDAILELAKTSRGNARSCVMRGREVALYCAAKGNRIFRAEDLEPFFDQLGILPFGLSATEMQLLKILRRDGQCSLQMLSAKTGLSRSAIQRDHELYLMRKNLIVIDGKRNITNDGVKLIEAHCRAQKS